MMGEDKLQMRRKATAKSNILHHKYTLGCLHFNITYAYVFVDPCDVDGCIVHLNEVKFLVITAIIRANRQKGRLEKIHETEIQCCMTNKEK